VSDRQPDGDDAPMLAVLLVVLIEVVVLLAMYL